MSHTPSSVHHPSRRVALREDRLLNSARSSVPAGDVVGSRATWRWSVMGRSWWLLCLLAVTSLSVACGNASGDDDDDDAWLESATSYSNAPGFIYTDPDPVTAGNQPSNDYTIDPTKLTLLGTVTTPAGIGLMTSNTASLNLDTFLSQDSNKLVTLVLLRSVSDSNVIYNFATKENATAGITFPTLRLPNAFPVPEPVTAALMALAAAFDQQVESAVQDDFTVKTYRDTAVVSFTLNLVGIKQGQRSTLALRYTDVWVLRDGRWQCVSSQSTRVAARP